MMGCGGAPAATSTRSAFGLAGKSVKKQNRGIQYFNGFNTDVRVLNRVNHASPLGKTRYEKQIQHGTPVLNCIHGMQGQSGKWFAMSKAHEIQHNPLVASPMR